MHTYNFFRNSHRKGFQFLSHDQTYQGTVTAHRLNGPGCISQRAASLQVLYMRSTWNVRGRHPATVSFHSQPGFEERHRGPASTSITDIKDFKEQSFPTKNQLFLFVAAVCVYDKEAGKVLIAQRVKDKNRQNKGTATTSRGDL